ncbi:MAG: hypothetical protein KBI47_12295 [Armatimonadetes bacterium]|nr:hypothetical protein [Armatimonadota bacterium]
MLDARVRVDWQVLQATGTLQFSLRRNLAVTALRDADTGAGLTYDRDEQGAVTVHLPARLAPGQRFSLQIEYSGEINGPRGGESGNRVRDYIGPEGTYVRFEAGWYPNVWGDSATARLRIAVPSGWTYLSSGRRSEDGAAWEITHPVIGISFCAALYELHEDRAGRVPIQTYLFPKHRKRGPEFVREAADSLALLERLYGPYPFDKFALAEIPDLYGGGHGDQSFIMLQERTFTEPFDGEFVTHEMAHNWWGGLIACTETEFLAQGFATYSQALWREHIQGPHGLRQAMRSQAGAVLMHSMDPAKETSCFESDSGPLLYEKGAWILHMLRHIMGDEQWMSAVHQFARDNAGRAVKCRQFEAAMEAAYGQPLDWFFRQWLYGTGVPWVRAEVLGMVGNQARVRVTQVTVQDADDSGEWQTSPGSFRLPVELALETANGTVRHGLWLTGPQAELTISVPGPVTRLSVDPGCWLLDHSNGLVGKLSAEMGELERELGRELGTLH